MDLRTRYTALVTLTTQHVKYISDALRRLEEEEVRIVGSKNPMPIYQNLKYTQLISLFTVVLFYEVALNASLSNT